MTCRICTELGEECRGEYKDCPQIEKTEKEIFDETELSDFLHDVLAIDIIKYNETHNVDYFKQRLDNEPSTEDLVSEAVSILADLLGNEDLEDQVGMEEPEDQPKRRENLNALVEICEKIAGVGKE